MGQPARASESALGGSLPGGSLGHTRVINTEALEEGVCAPPFAAQPADVL